MSHIGYAAAACQTDLPNPIDREGMRHNTDRMPATVQSAVDGSAPFLPVRPVVFPEFAHAAPVFATVGELPQKLAVPVPNEHTDRLERAAKALDIHIQSGTMLEVDARWPGIVFNTTCLIGPEGILYNDGRLLAEASPGPGERIVVAPIDISAVRHERATRHGHHMLSHLRTEAYPVYARHQYPPQASGPLSYERNIELIETAKQHVERAAAARWGLVVS